MTITNISVFDDNGKQLGWINTERSLFHFRNSKIMNFYGIDTSVIEFVFENDIENCEMQDSETQEVFSFPLNYYLDKQYYIEPTEQMHLKPNQRLVSINRIQGKIKMDKTKSTQTTLNGN